MNFFPIIPKVLLIGQHFNEVSLLPVWSSVAVGFLLVGDIVVVPEFVTSGLRAFISRIKVGSFRLYSYLTSQSC